jgi:hypothetical protein
MILAMHRGVYLRSVLVAQFTLCFCPRFLYAQLPPRVERCLPYPTFAEEMSAPSQPPAPSPEVAIASISFASGTNLPEPLRAEVVKAIKSLQPHDSADKSWVPELQQVAVHEILLDAGYFASVVTVDATLVDEDSRRARYALTLHIEEGRQHTLDHVHIANVRDDQPLAFPVSELRETFQLKQGNILDASIVREGLRKITALYGSRGYIDMTALLEVQNLDARAVNLLVKIDEQRQFRIGKLDFVGLTEKTRRELRTQLKPGDIFDSHLVDELISQNKLLLPADVSRQDVEFHRNVPAGTVDITFNFWSCPDADQEPPH